MKRMTKEIAGAVLMMASAAQAQTAVKATSAVNVRTGPGTGYAVMGAVPQGHVYVAAAKTNGWWKIWFDGRLGYTIDDYYTSPSGLTGVKVTTDSLNVRSGPGTGYAILGKVSMGQVYFWGAQTNGWYRISWGGRDAYVSGSYVSRVSLKSDGGVTTGTTTGTTTGGTTTNLSMAWAKQVTNYFCGPATVHLMARYLRGAWYDQWTIAYYMGTPSLGFTDVSGELRGLRNYASASIWMGSGFSRDAVIANIGRKVPFVPNFNTRYIAYWGGYVAGHYSIIKGYTSGGYYVHDTWQGPDRWCSNTEMWNGVNYWTGKVYRIY